MTLFLCDSQTYRFNMLLNNTITTIKNDSKWYHFKIAGKHSLTSDAKWIKTKIPYKTTFIKAAQLTKCTLPVVLHLEIICGVLVVYNYMCRKTCALHVWQTMYFYTCNIGVGYIPVLHMQLYMFNICVAYTPV